MNNNSQVTNCTFVENKAQVGGGLLATMVGLKIYHCTIANNYASKQAGGITGSDGIILSNSILAYNRSSHPDNILHNCNKQYKGSHNIQYPDINKKDIRDKYCGSNTKVANPKLDELKNNGGFTPTLAILSGSPAINTGQLLGVDKDQRGKARVANPDKGAYEFDGSTPAPTPTPVPTPPPGTPGVSYELINAKTDKALLVLSDKQTINLPQYSLSEFNINVKNIPTGTDRVEMNLSGAVTHAQIEKAAPYALFGNSGSDYNSGVAKVGAYTFKVKFYAGSRLLKEEQIGFTFSGTNTPAAPAKSLQASYELINAKTDKALLNISDKQSINLSQYSLNEFNVNVKNTPSGTNKVVMSLSGAISHTQSEAIAPYALFGDNRGNYHSREVKIGSYTLKAQFYNGSRLLLEEQITFSFASPLIASNAASSSKLLGSPDREDMTATLNSSDGNARLNILPNPVVDRNIRVNFPEALAGEVRIVISNEEGRVFYQTQADLSQAQTSLELNLPNQNLKDGVYYLRIENNGKKYEIQRLVIQR
ncbi:MAG: T9SS type A sorting domain-containing protein [Bacteroidia bacterium]|nr:T9SS type A sorting domain-containing protein [Bacteroidia bacterium]